MSSTTDGDAESSLTMPSPEGRNTCGALAPHTHLHPALSGHPRAKAKANLRTPPAEQGRRMSATLRNSSQPGHKHPPNSSFPFLTESRPPPAPGYKNNLDSKPPTPYHHRLAPETIAGAIHPQGSTPTSRPNIQPSTLNHQHPYPCAICAKPPPHPRDRAPSN